MLSCVFLACLVAGLVSGTVKPELSLHLGGDPNIDECEDSAFIGELSVNTANELSTFINPCIRGDLISYGNYFRLKWFHAGDELEDLMSDLEYTGNDDLNTLKEGGHKVSTIWTDIIPSSVGSFVEILAVKLYSVSNLGESDESEEELDSFNLLLIRPEQSAGQGTDGFVVLTSEPSTWRSCKDSKEDISSVIEAINNGETLYVCVLFYNPICPNNDILNGNTLFTITVKGISNGLEAVLSDEFSGPTDNAGIYECDSNGNSAQTFRYCEISNYGSLESISIEAEMTSYEDITSVVGSKDFSETE